MGKPRRPAEPNNWGPVRHTERIVTLDVLRGVAVFGMLLANIVIFAFPTGSRSIPQIRAGAADTVLAGIIALLVEGKFYTLFCILFGMGLMIQSERALQRDLPFPTVYRRRLIVLLVIGLAHGLLFSAVDILAFYAIVAFVAARFRKVGARQLLVSALLVYAAGMVASGLYAVRAPQHVLPSEPSWRELLVEDTEDEQALRPGPVTREGGSASAQLVSLTLVPLLPELLTVSERELYEFMADERRIFQRGSWSEMTRHRAVTYLAVGMPLRLVFASWRVLGLFLLGMYFVKRYLLVGNGPCQRRHRDIALAALGLGVILHLVGGAAQLSSHGSTLSVMVALIGLFVGVPALSLAYASTVALICAKWSDSTGIRAVAAVGRMALSNYLAQSVVCGLIFYGYGLGLFGQLTLTQAVAAAIPIFMIQLVISTWWLHLFRFGPVEWIWRVLSYRELQPLLAGQDQKSAA